MNSITRNDLMNKLYQSAQYSELENNKARVNYLLNNVMNFNQIKSVVEANVEQAKRKNAKNFALAKNLKIEADFHLQQVSLGNFDDKQYNLSRALKSYKKAILYMPVLEDAKMAAKLYARKCQVHLQLNENEAALYSIQTALDICRKYAGNISPTMIQYMVIEVNCFKILSRYGNALELIDQMLELEMDPEMLSSAMLSSDDLLKMKENIQNLLNHEEQGFYLQSESEKEYFNYRIDERCIIKKSPIVGRHMIAKEDIEEDTVILEEKPYSIIIENDYLHKKCSSCFKNLNYKFFPCLYCIELVFCDRHCFEEAFEIFHKHECGMISILKSITSPSFHVFRMVSRVGPMSAYETEKSENLKDYSIDEYLNELNQRLLPEKAKSTEEKLRAYKMSSILWDHDSKHSAWANVHHIVIGLELSILLDIVHGMHLNYRDSEFMLNFINMIIVDIRRIIFNVFGWHEYNEDWSLRGHVANCQCLVGSLINHSCVPNVNWEFKNGQIVFTTNKLIQKNEEITITYGPNKTIAYNRRQERLNHYFFACRCSACLEDARKGKALKCTSCQVGDGIVPFDVPLNNEPVLSGQCLICFNKYPDFEVNTKEYKKCFNQLKEICNVFPLNQDLILFEKAKELIKRFVNLSVAPNSNIDKALLLLTNIVKTSDTLLSYDEKLELVYLIDCFLSLEMEYEDYETLENLFYWFDLLIEYIHSSKTTSSIDIQCKAWISLIRFKNRINGILETYNKSDNNQTVCSIIQYVMENLNKQLDNLKNECESFKLST